MIKDIHELCPRETFRKGVKAQDERELRRNMKGKTFYSSQFAFCRLVTRPTEEGKDKL